MVSKNIELNREGILHVIESVRPALNMLLDLFDELEAAADDTDEGDAP